MKGEGKECLDVDPKGQMQEVHNEIEAVGYESETLRGSSPLSFS